MQRNGGAAAGAGQGQPACASCKHQRKKCDDQCVLAPYFPSVRTEDFKAVQKVFGVSNTTKMVQAVEESRRMEVAESLIWEAKLRQANPVDGPARELRELKGKCEALQKKVDFCELQIHQYRQLLMSQQTLTHAPPPGTPPALWPHPHNDANGTISSNGAGKNNSNGANVNGARISNRAIASADNAPNYAQQFNGRSPAISPSQYPSNGHTGETANHREREIAYNRRGMGAVTATASDASPYAQQNGGNSVMTNPSQYGAGMHSNGQSDPRHYDLFMHSNSQSGEAANHQEREITMAMHVVPVNQAQPPNNGFNNHQQPFYGNSGTYEMQERRQ